MALNDIKNSVELLDGEQPLRLQQRFLVLRKLGQGTYGKVQLALNKEKNEEVAIKTIKKGKIENAEDMLRIRREIHIMTVLRHPHIIHINEVFESRQKIVIVMQYASGGELYDYLGCHQTLPEDEARRLFRQIASAIYYCHKNQICHRDLKLENILLDEEGNAQIADFGLSNIFDAKRRLNTFCGSPLYASPEIVKGTPYKGPEVDCWSLGVLLYTLVYGTMPFDGRSFKELVSQISEGRYEEPVNKSSASSLIRRLLTPDITRRATIHDVCTDNWINQGYDTSLLEEAENMALMAGLSPREQISVTKLCLEGKTKNGQDKSIFKKAAAQLEEKAGKITSFFTKNLESIAKTNDINSQMQKTALFHQITNYDVHYVLNKLIAAVEASLNADKNLHNSTSVKGNMHSESKIHKKETISEKVDSAYVIPIFEVTSNIPKDRTGSIKIINEKTENSKIMNSIPKKIPTKESSNQNIQTKPTNSTKKQSNLLKNNNSMKSTEVQQNGCSVGQILRDSHKHIYSFNNTGEPQTHKTDFRSHTFLHHPTCKVKPVPTSQKNPNPFLRTKHHVLSLARLLSLNYEKLMRNSFRTQPCKKKLPGKITIPPTFDPNNPPTATKKQPDDKKELLIFPTISVSENKVKIEKKIEKIKKAALNKNLIIRSDTQTRMRIEKYIRSQVKKIQDLVCEDQRSIHASLEHLDEQSIRDMSEMYYCAFGSENTDSGIANTEDEEYFCFLCSRPNDASRFVDSFVLESLKKGCQYTSNHLHIPRPKEQIRWGYSTTNGEFGSLYRCRSEIQFPVEYLNYISSKNNKSDLQKRTQCKQQIQRSNFGNKNCFSTWEANTNPDSTNLRILRSASDSVGLNLNKNTFEILKLSTEGQDDMPQNYSLFPRFLEQTSTKGCNYSQMTDYETQSTATDATFINTSQILDKDDGIGDSNDSFQSYIDTFENNFENGADMSHLTNSKSYTNFSNANFKSQRSSKKILSEPHLINRYENFDDSDEENCDQGDILADILDCTSRVANLMSENQQIKPKLGGLRRRNTMTCIRDGNDFNESCRYSQSSTEFENYLWNAYKEHLLEANITDSEYLSTQSFNSFSLDRKTKFRNNTSKSIDINGGNSTNDFEAKLLSLVTAIPGYESKTTSTTNLKNIRKHSNVTNAPEKSIRHLGRTKSICSDMLSDSDREEIIQKLRADRMSSLGNSTRYVSKGCQSPLTSTLLDDLEKKVDHSKQRRHFKSSLPSNSNKRNKSEYKKSFLQLLALKRIQEAEKELDKSSRNETSNVEGENPGSLLEALKTHGYKTVISQRFQDPNDDDLDPYHRKNLKSPRNLRAELARLNHMYYETMPMYTLDPCDEMDYSYEDLDCTRYMFNGLPSPSYDVPTNYKQRMPKQSVYDWLDSTQIDEYLNSLRSDLLNNSEETANSGAHRCCPQWKRETYHHSKEESSLEDAPQDINEISLGAINDSPKNKERMFSNEIKNLMDNNGLKLHSDSTEDERQETVHDRIWRKSFYSRFNNRALSRKRSSIIEPELSESRLGQLNDLYNNRCKTGYEKYDFLKRDCSNKSFHTKRPKNQSPSKESFESRGSTKKKCVKNYKKMDIELENEASSSNKDFIKVDNTE